MSLTPRSGVELGERAVRLGLDVERLEALPAAAFVAGEHQLAHLRGQGGVVAAARAAGRRMRISRPKTKWFRPLNSRP